VFGTVVGAGGTVGIMGKGVRGTTGVAGVEPLTTGSIVTGELNVK
jgi:hypothetical protein